METHMQTQTSHHNKPLITIDESRLVGWSVGGLPVCMGACLPVSLSLSLSLPLSLSLSLLVLVDISVS
eukprot:4617023-Alexandrium_andersonii.AAC.1